MVDIDTQIIRWRDSSQEDWDVAEELAARGHVRHGLFFAHLALEKALKALVCGHTRDIAPRMHNLVRLAQLAGLQPSQDQLDVLAAMNAFQIEGRYPDLPTPPPTQSDAEAYMHDAKEVFGWLLQQL